MLTPGRNGSMLNGTQLTGWRAPVGGERVNRNPAYAPSPSGMQDAAGAGGAPKNTTSAAQHEAGNAKADGSETHVTCNWTASRLRC